jgi:steroid 5-alpha reductase family enzyme
MLQKETSVQSYDAKCLFVSANFRYLVIFLTTGFCCAFEQMLVSLRFFDKYYRMKIITTAVLLLITLLVVPLFSYFFGTAPGPAEWAALQTLFMIAAGVAAYCFLVGELSNNNSQVDKLWSIIPIVYTWVVASYGDYSPRLVLMGILVTLWGVRLTANFALKGAYQWQFWGGEEDYRWVVLRQKPEFNPRWKWTVFNLLFISGYQNALILLFTLPTIVVLQHNTAPLGYIDYLAAGLMLFFLAYETLADLQQWRYQSKKHAAIRAGETLSGDFEKGFLDKGLWAFSRHPNYFAEQAIWLSFYLFGVSASGAWFNWSIAGALLLIVLFQGSSSFSEEISAGKYPGYAAYQKKVPRFFPIKIGKA